ncbi:MAG: DUF4097 family beta strand repeat protein [Deltaproteobacteria bacterium]|nr:DUF4097 family beta strand repeat protein [Deltaproteobacteria bacterium]MBW2414773.1 DUF4097 family beta strand repeat protein [Deltaproteobacteria bacterium]
MILAAALCTTLASVPSGSARAQDLDRRIPVRPAGLLQVDLDLGEEVRPDRVSLEVRSHDADEVWIVAELSGLGDSSVKFRVEHDEQTVRLYARSGGLMSWLFGGPGVTVNIWVPREFSLDLRSSSGPIRIEDVRGEIRARTTEAVIEVRAVEGRLKLRTDSGSVEVVEMLGAVEVKSTAGSVELAWVTGDVEVRTGEGDILIRHVAGRSQLRTGTGEIEIREARGATLAKTERGAIYASFAGAPEGRLETRRGSVVVAFPSHMGAALDARTRHGVVEVDQKPGGSEYIGAVNGGGEALVIYSARGSIRVGRR